MTNLHNNGLRLDHGIESVSHHRHEPEDYQFWPDQQALPPPSQTVKTKLTEILSLTDTDSYLRASLQPNISNHGLLTPARFHSTISTALTNFQHAAKEQSAHIYTFNRAVNLLMEEMGLRELTHMYRSTLYQG
jgi:hypothetical protein